jgi:hypothetical protein
VAIQLGEQQGRDRREPLHRLFVQQQIEVGIALWTHRSENSTRCGSSLNFFPFLPGNSLRRSNNNRSVSSTDTGFSSRAMLPTQAIRHTVLTLLSLATTPVSPPRRSSAASAWFIKKLLLACHWIGISYFSV